MNMSIDWHSLNFRLQLQQSCFDGLISGKNEKENTDC
jgi:hypothetical protein